MIGTLLVLVACFIILTWNIKLRKGNGDAFDLPSTHVLKGLCAIIVVLVHFPENFQNPLQDAAGSFAYVAVTFFFFVSAYGMEYSFDHRQDYLKHFWRGRLMGLLIPMILINLLSMIFCFFDPDYNEPIKALVSLNGYVRVLLEYCLAFYLIHYCRRRYKLSARVADWVLISLVVSSSLILYFVNTVDDGWPYERLGLVWGLLAYRNKDAILRSFTRRNLLWFGCAVIVSGLLGVAYLKFKTEYFWGGYLLKIVLGVSLITLLFVITTRWRTGNKASRFLSNISYEIYLSHGLCMNFVAFLLPCIDNSCFAVLTFAVTIIVSWLVRLATQPLSRLIK